MFYREAYVFYMALFMHNFFRMTTIKMDQSMILNTCIEGKYFMHNYRIFFVRKKTFFQYSLNEYVLFLYFFEYSDCFIFSFYLIMEKNSGTNNKIKICEEEYII